MSMMDAWNNDLPVTGRRRLLIMNTILFEDD